MTPTPWPLSWPDDAPAVYERAERLVQRTDSLGDRVDQALTDIENDAPAARRASTVSMTGVSYWSILIEAGGEVVVIYWRQRLEDSSHFIAYVGPPPRQS